MSAPHRQALGENAHRAVELVNRGIVLHQAGRMDEALPLYNEALALDPRLGLAYFNRGMAHFALGAHAPMWQDFNRALELEPGNVLLWQKISIVPIQLKDYIKGIELLHRAVELDPGLQDAWLGLADAYSRIGKYDTAKALYDEAAKKFPANVAIAIERALLLPPIPMSREEIPALREQFMRNLDALMESGLTMTLPERQLYQLPFYHGYHGCNDRELMQKMAQCFLKLAPSLSYTAPHCTSPPKPKEKIRVGILSEFTYVDTLNQFFGPLIEGMAKDGRYEVVLFSFSARQSPWVDRMKGAVRKYVVLPMFLKDARRVIADEALDMLLYQELGMSVLSYFLAFSRLAPIQCVMPGHPITSGVPTIDYYFTARSCEPDGAAAHYTETLEYFDRNAVVFTRPDTPRERKPRAALGLPDHVRLYACPVMPFKLHPDMDGVFAEILRRDDKAHILLFESGYRTVWTLTLKERLTRTLPPALLARIRFLPFAPGGEFYHLMRAVDAVLDTFHFSFGTTAFLMLGDNIPFVTLPGAAMRGRCALSLYTLMDMPELIATSPEHFIELALKLAQDKEFHGRMAAKIRGNGHKIFDRVEIIDPFAARLKEIYDRHSRTS